MPDVILRDPILVEIVDRVVAAFHPEAVYLFGSRARGDWRADSDYDLLMVLPDDFGRKIHPFELHEATKDVRAAIDLVPVSHAGFRAARDQLGNLSHEAFHHGRRIYAR